MEWTLSWLMRNRRLSKDYERKVHTTQTFNEVTIIRLMLKRLAWEVLTFTKQALRSNASLALCSAGTLHRICAPDSALHAR